MQLLDIRLLGEFSAVDHRGNALSIGSKRTQALVVYLALKIGGKATSDEAGQLICPGEPEGAIRAVVRDLHYAVRFLSPELLIETSEWVRFNPATVSVDAQRFSDLIASPSINSIRESVDLFRGNLLESFSSGIPAFDDWITERRLSYWRGAVTIFGRLLAAQIKAGWWENAVETASRLLSLDPSQEVVHRTLMRLQLEQGRPDSALRRYQECADVMRRDYGRDPSPETEHLHAEIRTALERTPAPREVTQQRTDRPVLVLLVEDDLVSGALMEGFLDEAGYEVVNVNDGADALMEIARRSFDLLILDINIPTLSGLRLFEIMIQKGIDTPAVFVTGIPGPEVESQSLEAGAADFMRKPIRKEVLLPRLRAILQRSRRLAQVPG
ncbi:MAG: cyclase [Acidobacteria bacterium]|nr:cyclase [Acidobacteriota bacterium]